MKRKSVRKDKKPLREASQTPSDDCSSLPVEENYPTLSRKRKINNKDSSPSSKKDLHAEHFFKEGETTQFANNLLTWYDNSKRDLPWRQLSPSLSPEDKSYSVLVSEVMLQQTQVVTVRSYYEKWMARWPTFSHLAKAPLEEVNELWAGMGYYSRARRLLEAAQKVDNELNGKVPLTSAALQEKLPGVGRYTAGAVASIAFGEKCPAVDGNVIRVLARMRCLGADCTSKVVLEHVWKIADTIVPSSRPGDFNQAMMDLGATICTPRKPLCGECPVSDLCLANKRYNSNLVMDIEEVPCDLCCSEPLDNSLGVMNFPRKGKKAPPRSEVSLVCIIHCVDSDGNTKLLLSQRPQRGLLAGLWEFPSLALSSPVTEDTPEERQTLKKDLLEMLWGVTDKDLCEELLRVKVVLHIFSHIRQQYVVYAAKVTDTSAVTNKSNAVIKWLDRKELDGTAISTAMKKVFQAFDSAEENEKGKPVSKKARKNSPAGCKKLTDFFQVSRKEKL